MSTHTGEPSKISRSSCRWNNGNGSFNASAHKNGRLDAAQVLYHFFFGFPEGLHIHLDDLRVLIGFEIIDLLPQIDHGCVLGIIEGPIRCLYHAVGQGNPLQNVKASNDSLLLSPLAVPYAASEKQSAQIGREVYTRLARRLFRQPVQMAPSANRSNPPALSALAQPQGSCVNLSSARENLGCWLERPLDFHRYAVPARSAPRRDPCQTSR